MIYSTRRTCLTWGTPLSLPPQSALVASFDADNIKEDLADADAGVCAVSTESREVLQYEYHILYSCSYSTPVLYFRAFTLG